MDIKKREKDILVSDDNFEAIFKIHGGKPLLCNYQGNNICQIALNEITTELEIKINKIIDCSCKWEDKDTISIFDIKTEFNLLDSLDFQFFVSNNILELSKIELTASETQNKYSRLLLHNLFTIGGEFINKFVDYKKNRDENIVTDLSVHQYSQWHIEDRQIPQKNESVDNYLERMVGDDIISLVNFYKATWLNHQKDDFQKEKACENNLDSLIACDCAQEQIAKTPIKFTLPEELYDYFELQEREISIAKQMHIGYEIIAIKEDYKELLYKQNNEEWYILPAENQIMICIKLLEEYNQIYYKETLKNKWNIEKRKVEIIDYNDTTITYSRQFKIFSNGHIDRNFDEFFKNWSENIRRSLTELSCR